MHRPEPYAKREFSTAVFLHGQRLYLGVWQPFPFAKLQSPDLSLAPLHSVFRFFPSHAPPGLEKAGKTTWPSTNRLYAPRSPLHVLLIMKLRVRLQGIPSPVLWIVVATQVAGRLVPPLCQDPYGCSLSDNHFASDRIPVLGGRAIETQMDIRNLVSLMDALTPKCSAAVVPTYRFDGVLPI
ncbi:hypothetical protein OPT61_g9802 [Boeremia exigua]|uniref:Uncharacterized protein n=1 Tax=Boeremia exigua TaxID=749465 RepID=A0ACC2HSJ9_9PLEO|nr:hypothetical protein OPT61_g9802 [Boeremia exigua]